MWIEVFVSLGNSQGLVAVHGSEDLVTPSLEKIERHLANARLVFDEKNRLRASRSSGGSRASATAVELWRLL